MRPLTATCLSFALALSTSSLPAFQMVNEGVYRVDHERTDEILLLEDTPQVHVLFVSDALDGVVSDVHLYKLRDWVARGGVLWADGPGPGSALVRGLVPVEQHRFRFVKRTTGNEGGELIVKGALPTQVIHDHPLTQGVERLYLIPEAEFSGTPNLQPLVEMTTPEGERGAVLAAVPYGRGWIVLDGTARARGSRLPFPFGRSRRFDPDHPNAVRMGERWQSYDWDRLIGTAEQVAATRLAGEAGDDVAD